MKKFYSIIIIHVGLILVTAGIVLFKIPNNFATGGVTGIAIIINKLYPLLSVGSLMLIVNMILLMVGLLFTQLEFELKTIYSTMMLSLLVWFFEEVFHIAKPITGDMMLELIAAILLLAAGSAILFYQNASSGGTDIIAKIINMKTHLHIGKTVLITDLTISIFAFFAFGTKIGMYSVIGVVIKGFLIDAVIEGLHSSKQVVVISHKSDEIKNFIMNHLERGVTIYKAIGGNTNTERCILNAVMGGKEAFELRSFIKKVDDKAFITVSNVSEIVGKGFKQR